MVLDILRQNKIVMLVVMFLTIGLAVWLLETFLDRSQFEKYSAIGEIEILCDTEKINNQECQDRIKTLMFSNN